ncbi:MULTISPECIES: alpha/beta hydrolase fold domain-containing protein [Micrococcaceae]|uniref:alpha/beta hydrolase fold domain-containing protein n=1 Tax=unclassified Kocuria TaxID=2649579 RepID=UPI0010122DAD|nr:MULTISPECIES: alpha/beta hydrolase fold domain-containing protein [unclassified Kocuria]
MTDPSYPVPSTISPQAQRWLGFRNPATQFPERGDTEGWINLVEQSNEYIARQFLGHELPVSIDTLTVDEVTVYVARPGGVGEKPDELIYLNFHGGGLFMGGGDACRAMTAVAALSSNQVTWGVDYRMPPIDPYPAALDDATTVYQRLLESHDPRRIIVGGGSAGGNLAAALALRAKNESLPLPAALILNTPEIDLTESGDTFTVLDGVDNVLSSLATVNDLYADGADLTDPYLSPIFGDLTGFPPTFLQSGTRDLFLSNTVRMHRKLLAVGVEAELHVFEAMPHGGFGGQSPEDEDHAAAQRAFIAKHTR